MKLKPPATEEIYRHHRKLEGGGDPRRFLHVARDNKKKKRGQESPSAGKKYLKRKNKNHNGYYAGLVEKWKEGKKGLEKNRRGT